MKIIDLIIKFIDFICGGFISSRRSRAELQALEIQNMKSMLEASAQIVSSMRDQITFLTEEVQSLREELRKCLECLNK